MKKGYLIAGVIVAVLLAYAAYQALVVAPEEATQGNIQRIFYYHVPSAWTAFLCFFANLIFSVWYLAKRDPRKDALAVATAEVGVVFCTIVLLTGPIWAKPVWGIWWTWDARLTSTLVLWLIYVSYLILRKYATGAQMPVMAAALSVFGFFDVIFVYMAIRWFRTQHPQPVVAGGQNSGLAPEMYVALLVNFAAFAAMACLIIAIRYALERSSQRLDEAHAMNAINSDRKGFQNA